MRATARRRGNVGFSLGARTPKTIFNETPVHELTERRRRTNLIILHSTDSGNGNYSVNKGRAHFVVEKSGEITYAVSMDYPLDHTGDMDTGRHEAIWDGEEHLKNVALGIEVVAWKGEEWNEAQYVAVNGLVKYLRGKYWIAAEDVLGHYQVAVRKDSSGTLWRGRKADPYVRIDWEKLGLPNNSARIDPDIKAGRVKVDVARLERSMKDPESAWYGGREEMLEGWINSLK